MPAKPFFDDAESSCFDSRGMPTLPGRYEFRRSDGRKILYTLAWMEPESGDVPRLKVTHSSRMEDYPYPAHALQALDGEWIRYLGATEGDAAPQAPDAGGGPQDS